MSTGAVTRRKAQKTDYNEVMQRFSIARSMLKVCHRSLLHAATAAGDEADVLAEAIEKLRQVYHEFDLTLPLPEGRS
jgi:hypothetical protein